MTCRCIAWILQRGQDEAGGDNLLLTDGAEDEDRGRLRAQVMARARRGGRTNLTWEVSQIETRGEQEGRVGRRRNIDLMPRKAPTTLVSNEIEI